MQRLGLLICACRIDALFRKKFWLLSLFWFRRRRFVFEAYSDELVAVVVDLNVLDSAYRDLVLPNVYLDYLTWHENFILGLKRLR